MANVSSPLGSSEEDWHATLIAVRVVVRELLQRAVQLEAQLNQTLRNSSKPLSSDPPQANPRATKDPTGRKSGGQPGHEGQGRKLKPESEVDPIRICRKVDYNILLSTLYCSVVYYNFHHIAWFKKFAIDRFSFPLALSVP